MRPKYKILMLILIWLGALNYAKAQSTSSTDVYIKGVYTDTEIPDSIVLYVYSTTFVKKPLDFNTPHKKIVKKIDNKSFNFQLTSITKPTYITMANANPIWETRYIMELQLIEPGDDITMNLGKYIVKPFFHSNSGIPNDSSSFRRVTEGIREISFSGKGAAKYQFQQELVTKNEAIVSRKYSIINPKPLPFESTNFVLYDNSNFLRMIEETNGQRFAMGEILNRYKSRISKSAYEILKLRITGITKKDLYFRFDALKNSKPLEQGTAIALSDNDKKILKFDRERLKYLYLDSLSVLKPFEEKYARLSIEYMDLLISKAWVDGVYQEGAKTRIYDVLKKEYSGKLRDYLITNYFNRHSNSIKDRDSVLNDALNIVKDKECLFIIRDLANLGKGANAYQFSLQGMGDHMVKLSDFKGKVVFMDFWYSGCGGCMGYYQNDLSHVEEKFQDNPNIVFITVSTDKSKEGWIKSVNKGQYTSPTQKNVVSLYTGGMGYDHPIIKHYQIQGYPKPLLIGKDGKIFCADGALLRNKVSLEKEINAALKQTTIN